MDISSVHQQFPLLQHKMQGKRLAYLDSAATTQKPQVVLDAIQEYYEQENANVHRGVHTLSDRSTQAWEEANTTIAKFFGARREQLILTRNATEALNFVIPMWLRSRLKVGKKVLVSQLEHHSNFVPWQQACLETGAAFEVVHVLANGQVDLRDLQRKLTPDVVLLAIAHVSNVFGSVAPLEYVAQLTKQVGAELVVDGAQAVARLPVDISTLGAAFYAFSSHKLYGPMGVGGLLVRPDILPQLVPALYGGGMIDEVTEQKTTFAPIPDRFVPGTPDVAGAVGLAAAVRFMESFGWPAIQHQEAEIMEYALQKLSLIPEVQIVGSKTAEDRCGCLSFLFQGVHAHDVAQILNSEGVAVRSGHHCTMPLHTAFGWAATVRASFGVYTQKEDIDQLCTGLQKVRKVFRSGNG